MPPGNSSNKPAVVERCSYCGNPSCSGERNHIARRFDTTNTYNPSIFSTGPQTQNISTTDRSVGITPATKNPDVLPSSRIVRSSCNVLPSNTVASTSLTIRSRITESTGPKPTVLGNSQLSRTVGLNKTLGSANPSTVTAKPAVASSSQSSSSGSNVGSCKTVESTSPNSVSVKPPAPKPVDILGNQSSSTSDCVKSNKTNCYATSFSTNANQSALKPVSLSSQLPSTNGRVASTKISGFTTVSDISTTLPAPKPLISHQQSSQMSGTVVASASDDACKMSTSKVICKNHTDVKQDSISTYSHAKLDLESWINRNPAQDGGECQRSEGNDLDLQDPLKKHSKNASIFKGAVVKFIGSRIAEVRVDFPDGRLKLAQLFVEKLCLHRNAPACAASMDIKSVLQVGDILKLVCTEHRKKDSGYHYFAHQAWLEDDSLNTYWANNDAESVNSFASFGSLHDSEKQQSKSSSRRRRRGKKETNQQTSNVQGVDISQWLDDSSQLNGNLSQSAAITEGCEYFGKVVKLRLPYAFLVEVELNRGSQYIFVYSKYFYPEGPNSGNMTPGLSINGVVSIGDCMVVIPTRSNQQKSTDYEWVAKKAWPKGKKSAAFEVNQNISENVLKNYVEPYQSKNSDFVWVKSDQDGTILSLQTDWGLVRELSCGRVFVFTRKNSYLFGLSLRNFVLEDVLQEGDLVKFSQEEGERGEMNASILYYGCQLPNFNSFVKAIHEYCEVRNIKLSVETDLTQLGEEMYSFK